MKSMWSPGKNANNTIHIDDVAAAAWTASLWIAKTGRKAANDAAGVPIQFHNDKSFVKEHPDIPPPSQTPVAPLFNLVRIIEPFSCIFSKYCVRPTIRTTPW